jgi:hypothetical protein
LDGALRPFGDHHKRRTIGLHFHAAEAIGEYIAKAELTAGPLFWPLLVGRRGDPKVIIMSVKDYINTIAPTPDWLKNIGQRPSARA